MPPKFQAAPAVAPLQVGTVPRQRPAAPTAPPSPPPKQMTSISTQKESSRTSRIVVATQTESATPKRTSMASTQIELPLQPNRPTTTDTQARTPEKADAATQTYTKHRIIDIQMPAASTPARAAAAVQMDSVPPRPPKKGKIINVTSDVEDTDTDTDGEESRQPLGQCIPSANFKTSEASSQKK